MIGANEHEQAMASIRQLALANTGLKLYEAAFELARRLKRWTEVQPGQFEGQVREYCFLCNIDFDEFISRFLDAWDQAKTSDAGSVLEVALQRAEAEPYQLTADFNSLRFARKIASIAWHLSLIRSDKPFLLPQEKLAALIGTTQETVSSNVRRLVKHGYLECVKRYDWGHGHKQTAAEYKFTGPAASTSADMYFQSSQVLTIGDPAEPGPPTVVFTQASEANEDLAKGGMKGRKPMSKEDSGASACGAPTATVQPPKDRNQRQNGPAAAPFESRFGGGSIRAEQYLAELMLERQDRSHGQSLPDRFWKMEKYKQRHRAQIRLAFELLRIYELESVLRALRSTEGKRVFTLSAKWLDPLIQVEQRNLIQERREAAERSTPPPPTTPTAPEPPRPVPASAGKHSVVSKLREFQSKWA